MKCLRSSLLALAMVAYGGSANATFYYYFGADEPSDSGSANTSTSVGTAETAWEQKVADLYPSLSIATFETNFNNVSTATGINADAATPNFTSASSNVNLSNPNDINRGTADGYNHATDYGTGVDPSTYGKATFNGLAGAGTPGFTIESTETTDIIGDGFSGQRRSGVFYNDAPTGKSNETADGWTDVLSIGKFNGFSGPNDPENSPLTEFDNDDFELELTGGGQLYAFAFNIINNKKSSGVENIESLEIFTDASSSTALVHIGDDANDATNGIDGTNQNIPGYVGGEGTIGGVEFVHTSFIGIVTDNPAEVFSFLRFNEDNASNDIGIFNLRFAVVPSAVPVPAAFWFFGSALIALFGLRRK